MSDDNTPRFKLNGAPIPWEINRTPSLIAPSPASSDSGNNGNGSDDAELDHLTTIQNEQVKLRATLLNTVAAGFIVAGVVTPIASMSRDASYAPALALILIPVWFLLAAGLHYGATLNLERMR